MALSSEQEAFRKIFADNLRQKITADGIFVEPDIEHDISEKFIHALVEFKEELRADFRTHQKTRGEMSWSIEREKCIADFAAKLNTIFAPIGGIKPQAASAFWSGKGVVRAAEFGTDFANTIPGFVINQVHGALHETFTKLIPMMIYLTQQQTWVCGKPCLNCMLKERLMTRTFFSSTVKLANSQYCGAPSSTPCDSVKPLVR